VRSRNFWHVWLYHIFTHYLIKGRFSKNKKKNRKCMFWFSLKHYSGKFCRSKKIIRRNIIKHVHRSSCKVSDILVKVFIEVKFSWQILEEASTTKFNVNPSTGNRLAPYGLTDIQTSGHDEVNSRFTQFCAPPLKNGKNESVLNGHPHFT
jgi:hypothetical protein